MIASLWCLMFGCALSDADSVFYRCFDQNVEGKNLLHHDIPSGNSAGLIKHIDTSMPTAFFIHGWKESCQNDSAVAITSALLSRGEHNVCCLDWSSIAQMNYLAVAPKTHEIAQVFSNDLSELHNLGISIKKFYLIGFSAGAHIAGFVGRILKSIEPSMRPGRITGLDVALPLFVPPACLDCRHLQSDDADYVDCIHTDGGFFGAKYPICDCDFYPNEGTRIQKTCPIVPDTVNIMEVLPIYRCSHDMSWRFYKEAIEKPNSHIAISCDSFASFKAGICSGNPTFSLGFNTTNASCSGTYYYETRSESPYGKGIEGTRPSSA